MQKQFSQGAYIIGGVLTLTGAIAHFLEQTYAPYVFSLGAVIYILLQFFQVLAVKTKATREQRLSRMGLFSSFLLGLAAYSMFTHSTLWVVALLIYALSTLFISFRGE